MPTKWPQHKQDAHKSQINLLRVPEGPSPSENVRFNEPKAGSIFSRDVVLEQDSQRCPRSRGARWGQGVDRNSVVQ